MSDESFPFGKYKGQPLEVIQNDKAYSDWLLAQSWFKEKYEDAYTIIINNFQEPADTPLHNAMQMQFLKDDYVIDILSKLDINLKNFIVKKRDFEVKGWDIRVEITNYHGEELVKYQDLEKKISVIANKIKNLKVEEEKTKPLLLLHDHKSWPQHEIDSENHKLIYEQRLKILMDQIKPLSEQSENIRFVEKIFYIEIKPTVSDDFPSVLRQIEAMSFDSYYDRERGLNRKTHIRGTKILLVGEYTGQGATQDEFIAFMKTKDINVIFS